MPAPHRRGPERHGGGRRRRHRGGMRRAGRRRVGEDRLPVHQGRPVGRGYGGRLAAASHRWARPCDRAAHDRRLHRCPGGPADRSLQPRRRGRHRHAGSPRVRRGAGPRTLGGARDHEARAQSRGAHGSRRGARGGSTGASHVHAEPQLPRGLRGLQGEARAHVRLTVPDSTAVCAFLTESHVALAMRVTEYATREIAPLPEPPDDQAARVQARELLAQLGQAGWFTPIRDLDLRAACLVREALAAASPLADAVFALQALGTVPILLAGDRELKDRWLPAVLAGRAIASFAMTEPEAGSDAAAIATTARRDGTGYVLHGTKTLISNAGIADFYTVFASTDPGKGNKGISAFVVPADAPGLTFVRPLVLSAPHPLGDIAFQDCRVPASSRLGAEGEGFKLGLATLDRLRATVAAAACGMAARALREALAHATQRRQFGRPLA